VIVNKIMDGSVDGHCPYPTGLVHVNDMEMHHPAISEAQVALGEILTMC
jgi:hypothetical protein